MEHQSTERQMPLKRLTTAGTSPSRFLRSTTFTSAGPGPGPGPVPGPTSGDTSEFNLEKITPEFAAKIVKYFILPMFDNSASSKVGKRLGHTHEKTGSVYTELKLSDQLNDTLAEVRNEVTSLTHALDQEVLNNQRLNNDLKAFKHKYLQK